MPAAPALERIVHDTLAHYAERAEAFWAGTRDHDVTENRDALLQFINSSTPWTLLDFGCGPGRDLKAFAALGHRAIGLDGVAAFAEMAREHSGCEVWHQDFLQLALPPAFFDGIFANASLQHVPSRVLPRVLKDLAASLKPQGVLFASIPRGDNSEGWNNGRYSVWHDPDSWCESLRKAGFAELTHWYRPRGLPREQQPWFASVWRRTV